jgi:hypothetical protein
MKCEFSGCTGSHTSNDWLNMCAAARERKRRQQAQWVRNKYWNNPRWAADKRWSNWMYKNTAAGMLSACRSATSAKLIQFEAIMTELTGFPQST